MKAKDILTGIALIVAVLLFAKAVHDVQNAEAFSKEITVEPVTVPARRLEEEKKQETVIEVTEVAHTEQKIFHHTRAEEMYKYVFSEKNEMILRRICMAEAEGEDVIGKALIIRVVMNRIESDDFPDSIEEVVMQGGQFSSVGEGLRYYTVEPDEETLEALDMVAKGWDMSREAVYFESCKGSCWQTESCEYLFTYGGHSFYK